MDHSRVRLAEYCRRTATALVAIPVATCVVGIVALFWGAPIGGWCLAVALTLVAMALIATNDGSTVAVSVGLGACVGASALYALAVSDISWDGLWYQQEAVIQLGRGWNPLRESVLAYGTPAHAALWIDFYPRAQWIASAPWYVASGRIDLAKIYNILVLFSAAFLAFAAVLRLSSLRSRTAAWLAVVSATNPVLV